MKTTWCKKCGETPDEDGMCDCCDPQAPYLGAYNGPRTPNLEHFPGMDEETDDSPCLPAPWWDNP